MGIRFFDSPDYAHNDSGAKTACFSYGKSAANMV